MMINVEMGRKIFTPEGVIDDPQTEFNGFTAFGVQYNIMGCVGRLVISSPDQDSKAHLSKLIIGDINQLVMIFTQYCSDNNVNVPMFSPLTMDYVQVVTQHASIISAEMCTERKIKRLNSRYMWFITYGKRRIFTNYSTNTTVSRAQQQFDTILSNNHTVVIDFCNIFKMQDVSYTIIHDDICIKYLNAQDNFIEVPGKMRYINKCGAWPTLRSILNLPLVTPGWDNMLRFIPIYKECWDNIRPMRINKKLKLEEYLKSPHDYILAELEEIRDVKNGAPTTANDVCHACGMYLYDDIYVFECKTYAGINHMCICAVCGEFNTALQNIIDSNSLTVLKTTYTKTLENIVLDTMKLTGDLAQLLIHGMSNIQVATKAGDVVLRSGDYIGVTKLETVIVLNAHDKKLYLYC
jgi:hypothetical protein